MAFDELLNAECAAARNIGRYSVRNFMEIVEMELPPRQYAWGGVERSNGSTAEIIGPPGLGKSRFMLNVAFHQILRRPFPNTEYSPLNEPLTWLFMGTENSIYRWQSDARKMVATLTHDERELLRRHLVLPTLEGANDAYMLLDDPDNVERCKATVLDIKPDVIVFDPWGDLCADELKDDVQRETVRRVREIARSGGRGDVPVFLLNHSRMGNTVYMSARSEGGNYGRNSKAVYGQMRNVFNLRPAFQDAEKFGDGIEIIDQKHNDRLAFALCAVRLNRETMIYEPISDFDHDAAQAEWERLARKRSCGTGMSGSESGRGRQLPPREINDYLPTLADYIKSLDEPPSFHSLEAKVREEAKATKSCAAHILTKLVERRKGEEPPFGIVTKEISYPKATRYGTPEQIAAYLKRLELERAKKGGGKKKDTVARGQKAA